MASERRGPRAPRVQRTSRGGACAGRDGDGERAQVRDVQETAGTRASLLIADALERLARETDEARFSGELTRYLRTMARFHAYSPGNALLILLQRPDATLVAGFTRWLALGRCVRKGEKGIVILAPVVARPKAGTGQAGAEPDDGTALTTQSRPSPSALRFRGAYVFDVAQTEVLPGKEDHLQRLDWSVGGDHDGAYHRLLAVAQARGIQFDWASLAPGHYGTSFGGRIELSEALRSDSGHRCLVLTHELAHELLHKGDRSQSRAQRELEAEATAYVVGQHLGIESANAPRYAALYGGTADAIRATFAAVSRAAQELITALSDGTQGRHEEQPLHTVSVSR